MHIAHPSMRCLACQHLWRAEVVNDAQAKLVIASWKAIRCPSCRAAWHKLAFVTEPDNANA